MSTDEIQQILEWAKQKRDKAQRDLESAKDRNGRICKPSLASTAYGMLEVSRPLISKLEGMQEGDQ